MLILMEYFGRTEVYGRDWVLLDKHRFSTCSVCSVRVDSDFVPERRARKKSGCCLTSAASDH